MSPIVLREFFTIECDVCGERMEGYDEVAYLVAESTEQAEEMIGEREWLAEGPKLTCPACQEGPADGRD